MPRVNQLVHVTITEGGCQDGKRRWSASIEASSALFLLSDELAKEGAIREIQTALRTVIRDAVAAYISSCRDFIKGVASQKREIEETV